MTDGQKDDLALAAEQADQLAALLITLAGAAAVDHQLAKTLMAAATLAGTLTAQIESI